MEVLSKMRVANDRLLRGVTQMQGLFAAEPAKAKEVFQLEVEACAQQVIKLLLEFQNSVKENIREDQRLIVVQGIVGGRLESKSASRATLVPSAGGLTMP